jgi:hypothetical protein
VPSLQGQVLLQEVRCRALGDALPEDGGVNERKGQKAVGLSSGKSKNCKRNEKKAKCLPFFLQARKPFLFFCFLSLFPLPCFISRPPARA